jgi:hypothetical protein
MGREELWYSVDGNISVPTMEISMEALQKLKIEI